MNSSGLSTHSSTFMRGTVTTLFAAISAANGAAAKAVLAEDVVVETPFAIPPFPKSKRGAAAMESGINGASKLFEGFRLSPLSFYPSPETDSIVVEAESAGTLAKGGTYSNQYVFIFNFREQKIAHWREYFNPLRLPDLS